MKELLKLNIIHLYRSEDKTILAFIGYFEKVYAYRAIGECCSYSWFEDIIDPENMKIEEIIGIEVLDNIYLKNDPSSKVESYGYRFKTFKGYTEIIYRNESNGNYFGSCEFLPNARITKGNTQSLSENLFYDKSIYLIPDETTEKVLMLPLF